MAVTRLKRKERRNKTTARVRVENIKRFKSRTFVKSPYEAESGIVLETADFTAPAATNAEAQIEIVAEEVAAPEVVENTEIQEVVSTTEESQEQTSSEDQSEEE